MQKWKGTDEQYQSKLMKFYKDLQETKEKTKREEEKMLKVKSAKNGVSVISIHGGEEKLGKDLNDEIMSDGRESEVSLRPSLRPPLLRGRRRLSSRWRLAHLNSDESKIDKVDSKKESSRSLDEVSLMEGRRDDQTLDVETCLENSLETQTKERSERKTRAEATEAGKAKCDQGGEVDAGGEGEAAGGEGKSRTMPDRGTATMATRILASGTEEVKKIQARRDTATAASKNALGLQEGGELQILPKGEEDLQDLPEKERDKGAVPTFPMFAALSTTSSSPTCCPPSGPLQRQVRPASERPCSRDRDRTQDPVQCEPDTEVRRGLSLR